MGGVPSSKSGASGVGLGLGEGVGLWVGYCSLPGAAGVVRKRGAREWGVAQPWLTART